MHLIAASKYMKQILVGLKVMEISTIIVADFNTLLSVIDSTRQKRKQKQTKISKDTDYLKNGVNQIYSN